VLEGISMQMMTAILMLSLLSVSCISGPRLTEIETPPARLYEKGYSILPLNEPGWEIGQRNQVELTIGKRGKDLDHTYVYHATLVQLKPFSNSQEFMSLIKEQIDQDRNPERFTELKISTDLYPGKGEDCVRIHTVHEDKKAKALSMRSGNMVMELLALACAHPKDKSMSSIPSGIGPATVTRNSQTEPSRS
jgi:hypothetical protein